jgi:hypothetical protein
MRAVVLKHSKSGNELFCRDREDAIDNTDRCLRNQAHKPIAEREEIEIRYETISKAEWEALPETNRC